ncbi:MAG: 16S rRNA (guanine(527)-N(7))-methyltransferase RsmG [Candidatus Nitrospinota bacterium M3_3B_026]
MRSRGRDGGLHKEVFPPALLCKLQKFSEELARWNRKFSFTRAHDDQIFEKLVAPSAWLGMLYAEEGKIGLVADFGCGPGIPGLPMAMADVGNRYLLIDANGKKIRFVKHCIDVLGLAPPERVETQKIRLTRATPMAPADRLVTRATGNMLEVIGLWEGKVAPGGAADFFKGTDIREEAEALLAARPGAKIERIETPDWFGNLSVIRVRGVF